MNMRGVSRAATLLQVFMLLTIGEGRRCSDKHPEACIRQLDRSRHRKNGKMFDIDLSKHKKKREKIRLLEALYANEHKPWAYPDALGEDAIQSLPGSLGGPDTTGAPHDVRRPSAEDPAFKGQQEPTRTTPRPTVMATEPSVLLDWVQNLPNGFFNAGNRMRLASLFLQAQTKRDVVDRLARVGRHGDRHSRDREQSRTRATPRVKKKKNRFHPMMRFRNFEW